MLQSFYMPGHELSASSDRLNMVLEGISRLVESLPRRTSRPPDGRAHDSDSGWPSMADEASSTAAHRAKRRRTDVPEAIASRSSQEYGPRQPSEPAQSPSVSGEGTEVEAGNSPQAYADEPGPRDEELGTIDLQRYLTPSHQYHQPGHGDGERRRALEAAIQVAKRIAIMQPKPESLNRPLIERVNFYDPSMYLTAEFAHTIMDSKTRL